MIQTQICSEHSAGGCVAGLYITKASCIVCQRDALAAENAKLRELLNEATESAEADLLAVGHQHESQARTYAMRSLRSFIERARAAVQPAASRTQKET